MESDDDVPLILTWDEANSGLLNEEAERGDESKLVVSYPQNITGLRCLPPSCTAVSMFVELLHYLSIVFVMRFKCFEQNLLVSVKPTASKSHKAEPAPLESFIFN